MTRNARAILLLLACAAITVAMLQLRNLDPSEPGPAFSAETVADPESGSPDPAVFTAEQGPASIGANVERTSAAQSPTLSGRVLLPESTPSDEQLWVELEDHSARARVSASGTFELPLPVGTKAGALLLEGTYLYLQEPAAFALADSHEIILEPVLGACIAVHVDLPASLPEEGPLLPGVSVKWSIPGMSTTRASSLDASGQVLLRALPTERGCHVEVIHAQLYDRYRAPLHVAPGQRLNLRFPMIRGVGIAGHVRHADGKPASGATLIARNRSDTGMHGVDRAEVSCDEQGAFELLGLRPGRTSLYAKLEGTAEARREIAHMKDAEFLTDIELVLGAGTRIAGQVQWPDGRPAPATEIAIYPQYGSGVTVRVEADEDGKFEALVTTSPPYHVRAKGALQEGPDSWGALLYDVAPGSEHLILVLRLGNRVAGRVVDDAGEPVTEFKINATPLAGGSSQGRESFKQTFTSDDGVFDFERLPDGHWQLVASASHHGSSEPLAIELPDQAGAEWILVIPRLASVSGRVTNAEGIPLVGGLVRDGVGFRTTSTKIAEDGSYHFTGLPAGNHALSAQGSESAWGPARSIGLLPGQELTGIDLVVASPASIHGTLHASMSEREGRQIRIASFDYTFSGNTTTDAEGRFQFEGLAADEYRIYLDFSSRGGLNREWAEKYAARSELLVTLTEGETRDLILGGPAEGTIKVQGQLTLSGAPLENQLVYVYPGEEGLDFPVTVGYAGEQGRFEMHLPEPGDYAFSSAPSSDHPFGRRVSVPDRSTFHYDITLGQGRISGTLMGSEGKPRAAHTLLLRRAEAAASSRRPGDLHRATTDAQGNFQFANLESGGWELRSSGGYRAQHSLSEGLAIRAHLHIEEAEHLDSVEFRLRPGATLNGSCLLANGSPAVGARIYVIYANGCQMQCWTGQKSNWEGAFRVPAVDAGTVEVYAELEGTRTSSVSIQLNESGIGYVDLAFD